ncbi:hypothetical protein SAMN05421823_102546 [Catalinimonas alkaloidigena]|uniref:Uncharacterized protein n=1 Tax=Catalinimonas alkaloidigena TaxID=1075417 RepID=A0A1G9B879_9BACT|nr:hypothetical protein SAMN05421823_102546 [Catalinimonas alkaloidigena]
MANLVNIEMISIMLIGAGALAVAAFVIGISVGLHMKKEK